MRAADTAYDGLSHHIGIGYVELTSQRGLLESDELKLPHVPSHADVLLSANVIEVE